MKEIDFKKDIEAMKYFANKNAVSVFDIVRKECRVKEEDLKREGIMVDMLNQEIKELQKDVKIEICDGCKKQNNCNHKELIHKDGCRVNDCDYFQNISIDAEKQIKENGKELYNDLSSIMEEEYKKHGLITPSFCANKLLDLGYTKIDYKNIDNIDLMIFGGRRFEYVHENRVVIPSEEYERLKRVENEKDRLYEIKLDLENQLIEKGWTDYEGADEIEKRVSSERAEKIMQDLKPLLEGFVHTDTGENLYVYKCKQFGVEIKE